MSLHYVISFRSLFCHASRSVEWVESRPYSFRTSKTYPHHSRQPAAASRLVIMFEYLLIRILKCDYGKSPGPSRAASAAVCGSDLCPLLTSASRPPFAPGPSFADHPDPPNASTSKTRLGHTFRARGERFYATDLTTCGRIFKDRKSAVQRPAGHRTGSGTKPGAVQAGFCHDNVLLVPGSLLMTFSTSCRFLYLRGAHGKQ